MTGRRGRRIAATMRSIAFGLLASVLSGGSAPAASPEDSPEWQAGMRATASLNEGRWSVRHSAATDGAGHLSVRKGTKEENARWVLIYGMTIAETLDLQQRVDGTRLPVVLIILPKGGTVELEAQASEDWHALTMPLTGKLVDALAKGDEVHLSAGYGTINYRATLAGSARALRKALNR